MKKAVVLLFLAWALVAQGDPIRTLDSSQLPFLGPRENFEKFMNRVSSFVFHFSVQTNSQQYGVIHPYSFATDGELRARIESVFPVDLELFSENLEKETPIIATIGVRYVVTPPEGDFKGTYLEVGTQKPMFLLEHDDSGNVVFPTNSVLGWPLVQYVVVTNVMHEYGIEGVEYIWEQTASGNISLDLMTANGSRNLLSDQSSLMVVPATYVDEQFLRGVRNAGYFVVYYNKEKGWRDWFDIRTGEKIGSSITSLHANLSNGVPSINVEGFPGTQVVLETSTDGASWVLSDSAPLDDEGVVNFLQTNKSEVSLSRARSVVPAALTAANRTLAVSESEPETFPSYVASGSGSPDVEDTNSSNLLVLPVTSEQAQ